MKKSRLLIDMSFTSILTGMLFVTAMLVLYPYITKGQSIFEMEMTISWFFIISTLSIILFLAPMHFMLLYVGRLAGPIIFMMIATLFVPLFRVDLALTQIMSPFYFLAPMFCVVSFFLHEGTVKLMANKLEPKHKNDFDERY